MSFRRYIVWSLRAAAILVVVLFVSCALWWGLAALGDTAGAAGARGVALVAFACLFLDFTGLVVLLSLIQLQELDGNRREDDDSSDPKSD